MTARRGPAIVFVCMPEFGHFQPLRALIARVARLGMDAHVFTDARFRNAVETCGGRFSDLFGRHPVAAADDASRPVPVRYVTYAARFAEVVADEIRAVAPSLVIHDSFAVIGAVVARRIGVPFVSVRATHAMNPGRYLAALAADPRVSIAPECIRAVATLRDAHGVSDASPFSYVASISPFLNLVCEPPQFLDAADRRAFEPVACFGCLPDGPLPRRRETDAGLRVYASFGTVVWRYFAEEAGAALTALADAFEARAGVRATISLAGATVSPALVASLVRPNVRVADELDQPAMLEETDLFVTHHGINSTHEAILRRTPMLSLPFFSDQPALAARCQELGLALPLGTATRPRIRPDDVTAALARFGEERAAMTGRLVRAAGWEMETLAARDAVMESICRLAAART